MALQFKSKPVVPAEISPAIAIVSALGQEASLENVEAFVRARGQAACSELMAAFRVGYSQAVVLMDGLENRQVIMPCHVRADGVPMAAWPRKLCT
jgi:hypothetical protein